MCVARGCLDLRVDGEFADHREPLAIGDGRGGKRMAQVMDPSVLEARPYAEPQASVRLRGSYVD